jgi:hypothetical protein
MKKTTIPNIVEFTRKTPESRLTFVHNLMKPKIETETEGGGNYWIHSLSAIGQVFKTEELKDLEEKINILNEKRNNSTAQISKHMFQRNIEVLQSAKDLDFSELKPNFDVKYLPKPKSVQAIDELPIQILPQHVYSFEENEIKKVGAIWFVSKLNGYTEEELSLFTYGLYKYLVNIHSDKNEISNEYCIAVDVTKSSILSYSKLMNKDFDKYIIQTFNAFKKAIS